MRAFNVFSDPTEPEADDASPAGFRGRSARLGPRLGASRLGMTVYDLPPGEAICPYHFEWTEEEWLVVLAGRPTLRTPEEEQVLVAGDVVCFPIGPDGAHHVCNATDEPVRVAMLSTQAEIGVAEYPDSDKIGVWAQGTHSMLRRSAGLDYWDGEVAGDLAPGGGG